MPETFSIDEDLNIMRVTATGAVTPDDQSRMLELIEKHFSEGHLDKLIVNGTQATSFPSTMDLFNHGKAHTEKVRTLRTAVVLNMDSGVELGFLKDVITNRGGNICIVDSEQAALDWLNQ